MDRRPDAIVQFEQHVEVIGFHADAGDHGAALGQGDNLALVKELCAVACCRVGGGVRTVERAQEVLRAGAAFVPEAGSALLGLAGLCWVAGFGLLCLRIGPVLWRIRPDGLWGCQG